MNFNFNISSQFGTGKQKKEKKGLTPQEEYWLDRILRKHSGQIFIIAVLFLALMVGTVVVAVVRGKSVDGAIEYSVIKISP